MMKTVSHDPTAMKQVFREGWSNTKRIDNWVRQSFEQFEGPTTQQAWEEALRAALDREWRGCEALDIGTGPGTILRVWARLFGHATGLDFSPVMLARAREIAQEQGLDLHLVEGDAEDPPFPDEHFDLVSSRLLLFTLPRPGLAIRRWAQLLRPGGVMILIGEERVGDQQDRPRSRGDDSWRPDARYRAALDQLPLLDHGPGTERALLEAVGLVDIRFVSTAAISATRNGASQRPFICVGRKPSSN